MKILGIIAEYNPFHLGHLYHLERSKAIIKPDYTIAVMSGNFTQRGEAAILDKWRRASIAIKCGIDLVIELPAAYAVQTAELFAYGGIQILNSTGCVTHVSFGSETDDIHMLQIVSQVLAEEPQAFRELLKSYMAKGISFPSARSHALYKYLSNYTDYSIDNSYLMNVLSNPNSILAIEYLKALIKVNSQIQPTAVKRVRSDYHSKEIQSGISSATAIRNEIFSNGMTDKVRLSLPPEAYSSMEKAFEEGLGPVSNKSFELLIMGLLRKADTETIKELVDVSEGLENRIKDCIGKASCLNNFLSILKTKRYVYTRLQRILIYSMLGLTKNKMESFKDTGGPQYIRILGFSKKAQPLLGLMKKSAKLPILTKAAHHSRYSPAAKDMFYYDCLATDLYSLGIKNPEYNRSCRDFTENIIIY